MMKSVAFIMPGYGTRPVGGYKIVFEYANRLVADGYDVHIVLTDPITAHEGFHVSKLVHPLRYLYKLARRAYTPYMWFDLDRRVKLKFAYNLKERHVPRTDIYIATAAQTSGYVNDYKRVAPNSKFYFIQNFETWRYDPERLAETYRFPLRNIVICRWLAEIVADAGSTSVLIENGLDFDFFTQTIAPEDKDKYSVTMLHHTSPLKGVADAMEALGKVKERFPHLKVNLFGVSPRPEDLPDWYAYYQRPDQETFNRIYNESAIYLAPSHLEGFGLTAAEAMQCGCAVACTDIGGYAVFCHDNDTALVSPVKNPVALAENVIRLIEDDALRHRIARAGHENIAKYTWERAYATFRTEIEK